MTDDSVIANDVALIIGGSFTPDSLSPEVHGAIEKRAQDSPIEYLRQFSQANMGMSFDARQLSSLHPVKLLEITSVTDPHSTARVAAALLAQLDAVMIVYDGAEQRDATLDTLNEEAVRMLNRINERRAGLRALADL